MSFSHEIKSDRITSFTDFMICVRVNHLPEYSWIMSTLRHLPFYTGTSPENRHMSNVFHLVRQPKTPLASELAKDKVLRWTTLRTISPCLLSSRLGTGNHCEDLENMLGYCCFIKGQRKSLYR